MNSTKPKHPWQGLAQQIAEEKDPGKIIELAAELVHALDAERKPPKVNILRFRSTK